MRQQQTKNLGLPIRTIPCISIGLTLISSIDNTIVYNKSGEHADVAELRGGTGRSCTRGGLANPKTLDQLTNLSPLFINEGWAS